MGAVSAVPGHGASLQGLPVWGLLQGGAWAWGWWVGALVSSEVTLG